MYWYENDSYAWVCYLRFVGVVTVMTDVCIDTQTCQKVFIRYSAYHNLPVKLLPVSGGN